MMNGGGMMGGGFFGPGILFILVILVIAAVVVWMMRSKSSRETHDQSVKHHSLDLLDQRLAKGEITEEEYDRLKRKIVE